MTFCKSMENLENKIFKFSNIIIFDILRGNLDINNIHILLLILWECFRSWFYYDFFCCIIIFQYILTKKISTLNIFPLIWLTGNVLNVSWLYPVCNIMRMPIKSDGLGLSNVGSVFKTFPIIFNSPSCEQTFDYTEPKL
jgi:hypothetical protein